MRLQDVLRPKTSEVEWRAARAIWAAMAVIVVCAILGVFGDGPVAQRTWEAQQDGASYSIDLERLNRRSHVSDMTVEVHAPGAGGDELRITLPASLVHTMTVRSTVPPAGDSEQTLEGSTFIFPVEAWDAVHVVSFEYIMRQAWSHEGTITIQAGDAEPVHLPVAQFVFP